MKNLNEEVNRMKQMMGLLTEEQKSYENKPIVFIGTAGSGKSTTAEVLSKKLGISRIDVDKMEGSEEYENLCKDEPGVEVNITRTEDGHNYGESNDEYKRCVLTKLLDKYGNEKVIFDIGGDSIKNPDLLEDLPNLFVFGLPTTPEDDGPYIQFIKDRRIKRAKEMGQPELEDDTNDEEIQQSINSIREFYKGKTTINPRNENGESKSTDELVDEVIFKLT